MECLSETTLHEYIEGSLSAVEKSIIRDHLIVCTGCAARYEFYGNLEKSLSEPVFIAPPPIIEQNVLRMLFPRIPTYSSVFAFIAAGFLLLVTSIYIYFDFANNSIVQAFQLTSHSTSNWLGSIIKGISTVFSSVYGVFKAINAFFQIIFSVNIGVEIIALMVVMSCTLGLYSISQLVLKKIKGNN